MISQTIGKINHMKDVLDIFQLCSPHLVQQWAVIYIEELLITSASIGTQSKGILLMKRIMKYALS